MAYRFRRNNTKII